MLKRLISSYIEVKEGSSVSNQFEQTFTGERFEDFNYNALLAIKRRLRSIKATSVHVLTESAREELADYINSLTDYLEANK